MSNADFDKEEQAILTNLVPEVDPVVEVNTDQPGEATAQTANPAGTTAAAPKAEDAPAPAATEATPIQAEPAAPQGDTRAALRASRRAEKRLRDELDHLKQEHEALKQGRSPVDTSISDAELAELELDFPVQAKIVRKQRALEEQLAQAKPAPMQAGFEPMCYDLDVQEVIDGVPDLVAWQYSQADQEKFQRATAYDKALAVDPDWQDKTLPERFQEAVRRTKAAFNTPPTPAATAAPRIDPATVIATAPVAGPKGISDFRGGAPENTTTVDYARMSDEQIMSSLPVS